MQNRIVPFWKQIRLGIKPVLEFQGQKSKEAERKVESTSLPKARGWGQAYESPAGEEYLQRNLSYRSGMKSSKKK